MVTDTKLDNFIERHRMYEDWEPETPKRKRSRANGEGSIRKRSNGANHESYRLKLSYHGKNNYKNVKNSISKNYGYTMDDEFMGVKNFAEQLAMVYSTFVNHY